MIVVCVFVQSFPRVNELREINEMVGPFEEETEAESWIALCQEHHYLEDKNPEYFISRMTKPEEVLARILTRD